MWKSRLVSLCATVVMAASAGSNVNAQAPHAGAESLSGSNYNIEKVMERAMSRLRHAKLAEFNPFVSAQPLQLGKAHQYQYPVQPEMRRHSSRVVGG